MLRHHSTLLLLFTKQAATGTATASKMAGCSFSGLGHSLQPCTCDTKSGQQGDLQGSDFQGGDLKEVTYRETFAQGRLAARQADRIGAFQVSWSRWGCQLTLKCI